MHYIAQAKTPKGGLILLHEAFGLTPHIRRQCDAFAALGYTTLAPDMLIHAAPVSARDAENPETIWQTDGTYSWLPQNGAGLDAGRGLIVATTPEQILPILQECLAKLAPLPVATIGYCWGGSVSFMAAKVVPGIACAASYYGGRMAELASAPPPPQVPVIAHMAKLDRYIPFDVAMAALTKLPTVEAHGYDADHGFNRDDGPVYDPAAAKLAFDRTLDFFNKHLK